MAHVADRKYLNAPRETGPITLIVGLVLFFAPALILAVLAFKPVLMGLLGAYLPGWLTMVIGWLINIVALAFFLPVVMMYQTWLERKLVARIQDRIGPNRAGRYGMMVPLADGIKMLLKEDIVPRGADKLLHFLAPVVILAPAMLIYSILPMGQYMFGSDGMTQQYLIPANLKIGILFFIAISSYGVVAIVMAGYASHNKFSLLGGMRAAAQIISYDLPLALSVVPVIMVTGALSTISIVEAQRSYWFVLTPWGFVGAILFFLCGVAEVNRTPFDLPEAESELVCGFHTEYSGMKFALFYMAEFLSSFAISGLVATLFLGGWYGPETMVANWLSTKGIGIVGDPTQIHVLPSWLWFLGKTYMVFFVMVWFRGTLPRLRVDQLMGFAWKFLLPMTLVNIIVAAIWYYIITLLPPILMGTGTNPAGLALMSLISHGVAWGVGLAILAPAYLGLSHLSFPFKESHWTPEQGAIPAPAATT